MMDSSMAAKVTMVAALVAIIGSGIAFLDARHAGAEEVRDNYREMNGKFDSLQQTIMHDRLERLEFEITELERHGKRLFAMPEEDMTEDQRIAKNDLTLRRHRYIRRREELLLEMAK